jgi:hypothetical protein
MKKGDITLIGGTASKVVELDSNKKAIATRAISSSGTGGATDVLDRTGVEAVAALIAGSVDNSFHVRDEKASSTVGKTLPNATWTQSDLQTVKGATPSWASLATNQVTLDAGTYDIKGSAPLTFRGDGYLYGQAVLYNVTDAAIALDGPNVNLSSVPNFADGRSAHFGGRLVIASTKTFEIQGYINSAGGTSYFGQPTTSSKVEVYADLIIKKLA